MLCVGQTGQVKSWRKTIMLDDTDGYINAALTILILLSMLLAFLVP
jgi:hypothetical protein